MSNSSLTRREELFLQALAELRESDTIDVEYEIQGPLVDSLEDMTEVFSLFPHLRDVIFDPALKRCSLRFEELASSWRSADSEPSLGGEFRIVQFHNAILSGPPALAWEGSSDAERSLYSEFRMIDDTPQSGVGVLAAVRIQPAVTPLEIWYYTGSIGESPWQAVQMELNYCGYLDALLLTKGTIGWQYLFTNTSLQCPGFRNTVRRLTKMLDVFLALFPQHDYTSLAQRLHERL